MQEIFRRAHNNKKQYIIEHLSVCCKCNEFWWSFLSSPLVLLHLTTAVVVFFFVWQWHQVYDQICNYVDLVFRRFWHPTSQQGDILSSNQCWFEWAVFPLVVYFGSSFALWLYIYLFIYCHVIHILLFVIHQIQIWIQFNTPEGKIESRNSLSIKNHNWNWNEWIFWSIDGLPSAGQVKLSFIVVLLHVGTYSGMKRRASQDHGATYIQAYNNEVNTNTINLYTTNLLTDFDYKYTVYKC